MITMKDQHGFEHTITIKATGAGPRTTKGAPRFLMDGANHPKGSPIRFKSIDKLCAWASNERNLQLTRAS